ncbi:MAG TPA: glycosyltransferase family 39 protein [Gaiellaceae bacterium]|nr:glycosyltransferase family 39 protein [Gaiellaceae bacterium]
MRSASPLSRADAYGTSDVELEAPSGAAGRTIRLRSVRAGVVTLGVVYVAVRLMLVWRFPPHVDEALFAGWTLEGFEDRHLLFLPLAFGNNPMQEWVGIGVMHLGVEPLTALRLVSLASGLAALFVVAWLAHQLGGDRAALAAAVVWVVLPFTVVYGAVGLTDPLVMTLVAAAVALQLTIARRPRLVLALLLGVVLGVGLLTKLTMTIALWLMPLGALVFDWQRHTLRSRLQRWLGSLALAVAVSALCYQVLRLSDAYAVSGAQRDLLVSMHSVGAFLDDPARWLGDNWPSYRVALRGYLTVPLVVTAAVGVAAVLRTTPRLGLFFVGWLVLPLAAVVALADTPYVRWLTILLPALVPLIAVGVVEIVSAAERLAGRARPVVRSIVATGVLVVLFAPALAWDVRTLSDPVTQAYPGRDDVDYVTDWSAGGPWLELEPILRRLPGSAAVAWAGGGYEYLDVVLRDEALVILPRNDQPVEPGAMLGIENRGQLVGGPGPLAWHRLRTFPRPRGGVPVVLYERGVHVGAHVATTPTELDRLLGDAGERYRSTHPAVSAWKRAWFRAHSP